MNRQPSTIGKGSINFHDAGDDQVIATLTLTARAGIGFAAFADLGPEYWREQLAPQLLSALETALAQGWTQTPDKDAKRRTEALSERYGANDGKWPPEGT